jgi:hypothetical protein
MGLVAWSASRSVGSATGGGAAVRLVAGVVMGVAMFGGLVRLLHVEEAQGLRTRFLRR